ncbi:hypothetical protein MMC31_005889 [Peltigera leucophlebia]|nr:hypothetical protein [Peltigera leucophlebia]
MVLFGLDLKVLCFWALLQSVASEHVRITLEPGQYFNPFRNSYVKVDMKLAQIFDRTEVGVFALTVPALVKTMTEVSMVTVTQVSIETTAVEAASSATTPIATALAISQPSSSPSSLIQTPTPVATVVEDSLPVKSSTAETERMSKSGTSGVERLPNTSHEPCNCQCLCPKSAFQVYGAMDAAPEQPTASTLPYLVTAGQRLLPPESSITLAVSSSSVPSTSLGPSSDAASSSAGPTITPIQPSRNVPFNINTYSFLDSVTVALSL